MSNYRKIYILFLTIFIYSENTNASSDINRAKQLDSKGYKLCQSVTDSDSQSDIYQEPDQKEDENSPAEIDKQPDENNDSETN